MGKKSFLKIRAGTTQSAEMMATETKTNEMIGLSPQLGWQEAGIYTG